MSSKMAEFAAGLGLVGEDLAETIETIFQERADLLNQDKLEAQIEFLYADYCNGNPDTMRALLTKLAQEKAND